MLVSGSEAVVHILKQLGVKTIFGYPGGMALPLYDSLYQCGIEHILTRHEQGAIHAADGYARATGKAGVVIATSGPGATNLITGIATANIDSIPLVCITCQVNLPQLGKDSFQEADISGITTPITKHNFMIKTPQLLPEILRKAFYLAESGRPGPVVIDIPRDIFVSQINLDDTNEFVTRGYNPPFAGDNDMLNTITAAIKQAKKPLIIAGGGIKHSGMEACFHQFIQKSGLPYVSTLMGNTYHDPQSMPFNLGMPGMHGTYTANMALSEADIIIALGMRFADRVTGKISEFAPHAKIAHFDIDASEIGKLVRVDWPLIADLRWSLPALHQNISACDIPAWMEQISLWQKEQPLAYAKQQACIKPQEVIQAINPLLSEQAYIVTDVGQHQMWAAQYSAVKRARGFLSSGGLGTMGYGLPAAIGAQLADPNADTWVYVGDGGIMMNIQEIATAVEHNLPIKIIVMNNHGLGMVRQWQRLFYGGRYSGSKHYAGVDFAAMAKAMGAEGLKVEKREDLAAALEQAKNCTKPILLDIWVEDDENVLPMVAPASAITEMIVYKGDE